MKIRSWDSLYPERVVILKMTPPKSQVTLANSLYSYEYRTTFLIVSAKSVRDLLPTFKTSSQEQHYFRGKKNTVFMEIIF